MAVSCNKNEKGEVLSPDDQKTTVVEVCTETAKQIELKNWEPTAILGLTTAMSISDVKGADKATEAWAEGIEEKWFTSNPAVVNLADINGKFEIKDGVMSRTDSKSLTLNYQAYDSLEESSKPIDCVASVTIKNSSTKILVSKGDAEETSTRAEEAQDIYVQVPSSVTANIKAAGKQEFALSVSDVKIGGLKDGEPTLEGTYSFVASLTAGKYKLAISKAKYSTKEVGLGISFTNNGKNIIKANFSGTGDLPVENGDPNFGKITGKAKADITLMGQVSLKGSLDYTGLEKYINDHEGANPETVDAAQPLLDEMCKYFDLGVYMKNACQGKLILLASQEPGSTSVDIVPAIKFTDGSETMLAEDYGYSLLEGIMKSDYIMGVVGEISEFIEYLFGGVK